MIVGGHLFGLVRNKTIMVAAFELLTVRKAYEIVRGPQRSYNHKMLNSSEPMPSPTLLCASNTCLDLIPNMVSGSPIIATFARVARQHIRIQGSTSTDRQQNNIAYTVLAAQPAGSFDTERAANASKLERHHLHSVLPMTTSKLYDRRVEACRGR